jgi:RNA polymerase sigma-70 factor (ECF subfamily)
LLRAVIHSAPERVYCYSGPPGPNSHLRMTNALSASSRPGQGQDDQNLINRVAYDSDNDAFQCLFLRFGPRVKALMIKSGASPDIAEDLVQDVMLTLWRKAGLYSPERGSVAAWVFTIARNLRIDRLRRQSAQAYEDVAGLNLEASDASGEEETHLRQRDKLVGKAIAELPGDQQRVIEMSFIQDMAQADIARKLNLPLGTVKSRMRLAYVKLRERLEDVE